MTIASRYDWAVEQLRRANARLTPVREKVLAFLARRAVPATLHEINASDELARHFDDATVYRTLVLLAELDIVRQFQLRDRATCFVLNMPNECFGFLVCRCCGTITPLPPDKVFRALERQVAALHRYTKLTHELELYGVCPACQQHTQACSKPSKLVPGLRLRGHATN